MEWVGVIINAGPHSSLHHCQRAKPHADVGFGLFVSATLKLLPQHATAPRMATTESQKILLVTAVLAGRTEASAGLRAL